MNLSRLKWCMNNCDGYNSKGMDEAPMNLPVATHIEKLGELLTEMSDAVEASEKELHVLRGYITELSYVNKSSDQELNEFLVASISGLRGSWMSEWEQQEAALVEERRKIGRMHDEHEDLELQRQELE